MMVWLKVGVLEAGSMPWWELNSAPDRMRILVQGPGASVFTLP